MREVRAASRVERVMQIRTVFIIAMMRDMGDELSAYKIANAIGMRPQSPQFRDILSSMVRDGDLTCRAVQTKSTGVGNGVRFYYKLAQDIQPKKREIAIKANGKQVGQLELF